MVVKFLPKISWVHKHPKHPNGGNVNVCSEHYEAFSCH